MADSTTPLTSPTTGTKSTASDRPASRVRPNVASAAEPVCPKQSANVPQLSANADSAVSSCTTAADRPHGGRRPGAVQRPAQPPHPSGAHVRLLPPAPAASVPSSGDGSGAGSPGKSEEDGDGAGDHDEGHAGVAADEALDEGVGDHPGDDPQQHDAGHDGHPGHQPLPRVERPGRRRHRTGAGARRGTPRRRGPTASPPPAPRPARGWPARRRRRRRANRRSRPGRATGRTRAAAARTRSSSAVAHAVPDRRPPQRQADQQLAGHGGDDTGGDDLVAVLLDGPRSPRPSAGRPST